MHAYTINHDLLMKNQMQTTGADRSLFQLLAGISLGKQSNNVVRKLSDYLPQGRQRIKPFPGKMHLDGIPYSNKLLLLLCSRLLSGSRPLILS